MARCKSSIHTTVCSANSFGLLYVCTVTGNTGETWTCSSTWPSTGPQNPRRSILSRKIRKRYEVDGCAFEEYRIPDEDFRILVMDSSLLRSSLPLVWLGEKACLVGLMSKAREQTGQN